MEKPLVTNFAKLKINVAIPTFISKSHLMRIGITGVRVGVGEQDLLGVEADLWKMRELTEPDPVVPGRSRRLPNFNCTLSAQFFCCATTTKAEISRKIRAFFNEEIANTSYYIIYYAGHGMEFGGSWFINEEETFHFFDLYDIWTRKSKHNRPNNVRLLLILDSCYSAEWVKLLQLYQTQIQDVAIQASGPDIVNELRDGGHFTTNWINWLLDTPNPQLLTIPSAIVPWNQTPLIYQNTGTDFHGAPIDVGNGLKFLHYQSQPVQATVFPMNGPCSNCGDATHHHYSCTHGCHAILGSGFNKGLKCGRKMICRLHYK